MNSSLDCRHTLSQVSTGALQAHALEFRIFTAGIFTVTAQLLLELGIIYMGFSNVMALFLMGASSSLIAIAVYFHRLRLVKNTLGVDLYSTFKLSVPPRQVQGIF